MLTGCYTENIFGKNNKGEGIVSFDEYNTETIKEINPSFLAYHNDILYCVNELEDGKLSSYKNGIKIDSKSTGKYPCHINVVRNKILVCNYGGGIVLFDILNKTKKVCYFHIFIYLDKI